MSTLSLPTASPASVGISPKTLKYVIEHMDSNAPGIHSIFIMRHNKVICKAWHKPFREDLPHMLFSLSKSFTSTAVGFMISEGKLKLTDKITDFFSEELSCKPCENMQKITIEDLLTMRSGHSVEPHAFQGENYVQNFLRSYVDLEPGTRFVYNTPATYMLSAIITKLTGQSLVEYLTPRLFEPLGIDTPNWESDNKGINIGGFGLNLKTEDLARFGTMLLNRGGFYGKHIISSEWIDLATSKLTDSCAGTDDFAQGYGFQFWRCVPEDAYRAAGSFGQYCIVMPKQDIVIAITSGTNFFQEELEILWNELLPNISDTPLKEDAQAQAELDSYVSSLSLPTPQGKKTDADIMQYSGNLYELSENCFGFEKIRFIFEDNKSSIILTENGKEHYLEVGYENWVENDTATPIEETNCHSIMVYEKAACAGCFNESSYIANICYNTTPFSDSISAKFDNQGLKMNITRNSSLYGNPGKACIYGRKI